MKKIILLFIKSKIGRELLGQFVHNLLLKLKEKTNSQIVTVFIDSIESDIVDEIINDL